MEDSRRDLKDDHLNSLLPDVQVDRRGFVAACIAAGFAVTAEPVLAQAIKTSDGRPRRRRREDRRDPGLLRGAAKGKASARWSS